MKKVASRVFSFPFQIAGIQKSYNSEGIEDSREKWKSSDGGADGVSYQEHHGIEVSDQSTKAWVWLYIIHKSIKKNEHFQHEN